MMHLCESRMRENRTSGLGGGRRPAPPGRLLRPDTSDLRDTRTLGEGRAISLELPSLEEVPA